MHQRTDRMPKASCPTRIYPTSWVSPRRSGRGGLIVWDALPGGKTRRNFRLVAGIYAKRFFEKTGVKIPFVEAQTGPVCAFWLSFYRTGDIYQLWKDFYHRKKLPKLSVDLYEIRISLSERLAEQRKRVRKKELAATPLEKAAALAIKQQLYNDALARNKGMFTPPKVLVGEAARQFMIELSRRGK